MLTPTHTGTQPDTFTRNGKTVRPLGPENDLAFKLVNMLDAEQQKQAVLGAEPKNLVVGPGQDGKTIPPEGLKCAALNEGPARDAPGIDRRLGPHPARRCRREPTGGAQGQNRRYLFRLVRADDQWQRGLLPHSGPDAADRIRSARKHAPHSHHHSRPEQRLRQGIDPILR